MIIGLVGCAASKLKRPARADELYTSQLFRKSAAYVAEHADDWYVLSAKHGLVHHEEVLEPYNVKLGDKAALPIWDWAEMVAHQLEVECGTGQPMLLVLAGEQYRTFLRRVPESWPTMVPMRGLGIGEQLHWLTERAS